MENHLTSYVPRQQWPESLHHLTIPPWLKPRMVGVNPAGVAWQLGPLRFERFVSDLEPRIEPGMARIVYWQRVSRTDVPEGWHVLGPNTSVREGYVELTEEPYARRWSSTAKRYRNQWLRRGPGSLSIDDCTLDEFSRAYGRSTVRKRFGRLLIKSVERKIAQGAPIALRVVRDGATHDILAGLATIDSPANRASYYECGFVLEEAPAMVMIGLMDDWFERSVNAGIRYLHLGVFWTRGHSREWKGFSDFKAKFNPTYIDLKPELRRFVRGRLF